MQQVIAAAWVGLMLVLMLDVLLVPDRWPWAAAAMFGVTMIGTGLFNAVELSENARKKNRRK